MKIMKKTRKEILSELVWAREALRTAEQNFHDCVSDNESEFAVSTAKREWLEALDEVRELNVELSKF